MKAKAHILSLDDRGDLIRVVAQGKYSGEADWRAWSRFEFDVPSHLGRNFTIGRELEITVTPKRAKT